MSEMLSNHYFMIRRYYQAQKELEKELIPDPSNKSLKKKLLVCYTQTGELQKALLLFQSLISEDIDFIINTDIEADDCPCKDLALELENSIWTKTSSLKNNISLGILWLYCDLERSYSYFKDALRSVHNCEILPDSEILSDSETLQNVVLILKEKLEDRKKRK